MRSPGSLAERYARFRQEVPVESKTISGVTWRWYEQGKDTPALVILPGAVSVPTRDAPQGSRSSSLAVC